MHPAKLAWGIRALLYKPFFAEVGCPAYIGKPCFIEGRKNIEIGSHVRIFPGIRMEAIGQGKIKIGDNVAIEQSAHIISSGMLNIGNDVTISANVFITNLDHEYTDISRSVLEQEIIVKETTIGDGCFVGYGAVIQAGTILGRHCVVGASSVVRGNYPDYSVIVGNPAHIIKKYNIETKNWERYGNEK